MSQWTDYTGNFEQITMQLMPRIEPDTKKTFELEEYFYHYVSEENLTVLCMTDKTMNKKVPFAFMVDLRKALLAQYNYKEIENAKAFQLQTFNEVIRDKMVSLRVTSVALVQQKP